MSNLNLNVEVITPDVAKQYITTNTDKQRHVNKSQVSFYARMMQEGQWQLNGEAIVFDKNGKLVNGQHRLLACIEANVSFETAVVRNVEENSFYTFDTGYGRSKGQIFEVANISNYRTVSSILNSFYILSVSNVHTLRMNVSGGLYRKDVRRVSSETLLHLYYERPQYWQDTTNLVKCMNKRCKIFPVSKVGAIIAYLNIKKGYDYDFVVNFFSQIFYEEQTKLRVIRILRTKLINHAMGNYNLSETYKMQLLIKAWNYYKENHDSKSLNWNSDKDPTLTLE